jgi:Zn-dependent protease with chaperone function
MDTPFAFSGAIEPTRLSPTYRFGLAIVAAAMLLLPVVYLGLIAATGAAVWWHLTENAWILDGRGASQWRLLMYASPAVVGIVLVFFMVKPIMARPSTRREPLAVDPDAEPVLFTFIEQICRQVRAPLPRSVRVDCHVNASAGFVPGGFGMFRNDLVLTIGLPLAAGLSVRELGGVLAHEFGHFAQGGGMRLTMIVRSVNAWFARVVYERDEWDEKLEHWSKEADWRLALVLLVARCAVWMSRLALTGLMMSGHAISCFMLRQMEYDADSYEIKLAGSDAFARTSMRMREMSLGAQFGYRDLADTLRSRMLPSNLPAFVVERTSRLPRELLTQIRCVDGQQTGWFDTHPADAERMRAAEAADDRGVLDGADGPATQLFHGFDMLSAAVTRHHYEHDLNLSLETVALLDTNAAIDVSTVREENQKALESFFGERASVYRPLHLQMADLAGLGATELQIALDAARAGTTAASEGVSERYRRFDELQLKREKALAAQELLNAGFSIAQPAEFDLREGTPDAAAAALYRAFEEQQALGPALEAFEKAAARRLSCGLGLATHASKAELVSLVPAFDAVSHLMPSVLDLRGLDLLATLLETNVPTDGHKEHTNTRIRHLGILISNSRERLRDGLKGVPCPSGFSAEPMTVAERCGLPPDGQFDDVSQIVDRTLNLYYGMLGRLAAVALQAEAVCPPLTGGPSVATVL